MVLGNSWQECGGRLLLLIGIVAGAFCGGGCGARPAAEEEKVPPAPVKWEPARLVLLEEWTELLGSTVPLPDHAARITAPIEGRVLSVLHGAKGKIITEGQRVQAGDVIVQLDDRAVRADLDKAVASQRVADEELLQAQSAQKVASIDVERLHQLSSPMSNSGDGRRGSLLVSPVEVKKAEFAYEDAESKVRAARAKLQAGAKEIESLQQRLKLYTLTAPRNGQLGRLLVVPGQTLAVGAPVADVVDLEEEIDVLSFVPPSAAHVLALGQTARLGGLDNASESGPEGKVVYIADQAETETGGFAVKVRFPNREAKLRANLVQAIRVLIKPGKECTAIPESALMEDQDPPGVIVAEDIKTEKNAEGKEQQVGKARRLQAITGVRDRTLHQIEIVRLEDKEKQWKGNLEQAQFIVEKGRGLQTGDAVKLQEEED